VPGRTRSRNVMISLRVEHATASAIQALARGRRKAVSELAREALRRYVTEEARDASKSELVSSSPGLPGTGRSRRGMKSLAKLLRAARDEAPEGDVVVRVHLFGIDHAGDLEGVNLGKLVVEAGVPRPYATEIRKGMRLADYVVRK
jgi:hypothetical protein